MWYDPATLVDQPSPRGVRLRPTSDRINLGRVPAHTRITIEVPQRFGSLTVHAEHVSGGAKLSVVPGRGRTKSFNLSCQGEFAEISLHGVDNAAIEVVADATVRLANKSTRINARRDAILDVAVEPVPSAQIEIQGMATVSRLGTTDDSTADVALIGRVGPNFFANVGHRYRFNCPHRWTLLSSVPVRSRPEFAPVVGIHDHPAPDDRQVAAGHLAWRRDGHPRPLISTLVSQWPLPLGRGSPDGSRQHGNHE